MQSINWMNFGLVVLGVVAFVWAGLLLQRRWTWTGLLVSVPHLLIAGMNGAAPVRALVDPNYVGYAFGAFLQADRGWPVTLMAGALLFASAAAAWAAVGARSGPVLWIVAAVSAFSLANLGVPLAAGIADGFAHNRIQFGEYLTIPGAVAGPLQLVLLAVPLLLGVVWGARRALGHGGAQPALA